MSDPRFAKLKSDPRFRKIRKKEAKVVVDERFKSLFDDSGKKKKGKGKARVDKYGRKVSTTQEQDDLRRFYRLDGEDEYTQEGESSAKIIDYARGAVLLESSDEEENAQASDGESDTGGVVTLGAGVSKPIQILGDNDELEVDLEEDNFADLDAQAAEYSKAHGGGDEALETPRTRRLAVVNLDWDHVRAIHLYKIFSSLVSPTALTLPSSSHASASVDKKSKDSVVHIVRGKVLSVRIYPSDFGKQRMAQEEKEGPPPELFAKSADDGDGDDLVLHQTGDGEDYNEEALRKYQLERLRYYYAIVECDSLETAEHLYAELDGTELERSANVFDLSFVPDDMAFSEEFRDEATEDVNAPYKPVEFVTDALRHSRVKLTWDDDDPERVQITRRTLTRKEIEENDFRAYIAFSSDDESEGEVKSNANREKLRALLLSGGDDTLPEGWGKGLDDDAENVDMEVTFMPGLSEIKDLEDETTLERYQRKMREKKKKRKEERKEKSSENDQSKGKKETKKAALEDDFFAGASDDDEIEASEADANAEEPQISARKEKKAKGRKHRSPSPKPQSELRARATADELALIAASDNPNTKPKHFDMKAVIKAEKAKGKKRKDKKSRKKAEEANELQEDFSIDVKDERFKAVLEDHTFAIDPSNPHFKKTKSMSALLEERTKRRTSKSDEDSSNAPSAPQKESKTNLQSLVESIKRKSAAADERRMGKRRKV